ncbi:MAG: hypothetical protein ABIJ56_07405 [Pseudomonadota bacterium]
MADGWIEIVPHTSSAAISPPTEMNSLQVTAVGSDIGICVNGQVLATVNDTSFRSGTLGLIICGDAGDKVLFDTIIVY